MFIVRKNEKHVINYFSFSQKDDELFHYPRKSHQIRLYKLVLPFCNDLFRFNSFFSMEFPVVFDDGFCNEVEIILRVLLTLANQDPLV